MAHWAELDNNNVVIRVVVGDNNDSDEGYSWLMSNLGGRWVKTSYNSYAGKYWNRDTNQIISNNHFRYNFAGAGYMYDDEYDAFYPPKPEDKDGVVWVLDRNTFTWIQI